MPMGRDEELIAPGYDQSALELFIMLINYKNVMRLSNWYGGFYARGDKKPSVFYPYATEYKRKGANRE